MRYTDEELESLLSEIESDLAERKETWKGDAPDTGRQAVCAFANDLPDHRKPGVLFVGAKNNGAPSGLPITDELLRRILNERRRYRDIPFDVQPLPSCDLSALSRVLFEQEYLPNAVAPDILADNDRSYEEKLASCRMIASADDPTPTILGVLVLGVSSRDWIPGAYIQFLRINGTEMTDPIQDEAPMDGALGQVCAV